MQLTEKQKSEGWRIVKFGDVAKSVSKRVDPADTELEVYVGLEHLDPDNLRITRRGVPSDVKGQKLLVKPGQIIFGKRRAYQRKVAVADFEGICSAHAMVLEAIPEAVVPEYLPFFMQSDMFMERAVAISEGSLSPTIKWETLANQEFPLPPRPRQEEILSVLNKGLESLDKVLAAISSARTLKRVTISKIFSYTSQTHTDLRKTIFSDVTEIVSGQVDPKIEPYCAMPHIAPDNMEQQTGRLLDYNTAEQDGITSGKYLFDETWILYSKIRPNLRKLCFPKFDGVCSADVYPIRGRNGLTTEYLFYLMQSEHFNQYAVSVSMRSGFPKINRDDLGAYKLPIPDEEYQKTNCSVLAEIGREYDVLIAHMNKINRNNSKITNTLIFKEAA